MKKKILVCIVFLVIISLFTILFLDNEARNKEILETKKSLVSLQEEYEREFKTEGYSFTNPQVILNPYQTSPLTALLLFETEEEITPKVTIEGRDEWSTYTYQFATSREHYLPIYGLYPDYENKVLVE